MKNPGTWKYIVSHYPCAVIDMEYKNGETLFYTSKEAYESMNESCLYSCIPYGNSYKILTEF